MQQRLRVTPLQTRLVWEDPAANRARFSALFDDLQGKTDLIVLPEMFSTGFSMAPESCAEAPDGNTQAWLKTEASRTGAAICGSIAVVDQGRFMNRFVWADPEGNFYHYDKRHLFRMGEESEHYSAGEQRVLIEYRGWRILPQVCYDLRFPVWCRNRNDYDLMLCVANWPAPRRNAWRTLLMARAIENQCYVVGVNRVGRDGNQLDYAGDSLVVDFKGELLADGVGAEEWQINQALDAAALSRFRERFPAWKDADEFQLLPSASR